MPHTPFHTSASEQALTVLGDLRQRLPLTRCNSLMWRHAHQLPSLKPGDMAGSPAQPPLPGLRPPRLMELMPDIRAQDTGGAGRTAPAAHSLPGTT